MEAQLYTILVIEAYAKMHSETDRMEMMAVVMVVIFYRFNWS
jgi:hypothetical protein